MKTSLLVLLLAFALSCAHAALPATKTVVVRYQPPAAARELHGQLDAADVDKAVRILKAALRKARIEVHFGTLPPAEGPGQLWIDGHLLQEWLGASAASACVYCGAVHAASGATGGCLVPVERIVQAGLLAGADKMGNGSVAAAVLSGKPSTKQ